MYEERDSRLVPGAVLWRAAGPGRTVLPDGCMDLMWVSGRLVVAGPDTGPHPAGEVPGPAVAGLRFAPGTAPALLGAPARELRDLRVDLADLWPGPEVRRTGERIAAYEDPCAGLEAAARRRAAATAPPDPLLGEVVARLRAGRASPPPPLPSGSGSAGCTGSRSTRSGTARGCWAGCCGSSGPSRCPGGGWRRPRWRTPRATPTRPT